MTKPENIKEIPPIISDEQKIEQHNIIISITNVMLSILSINKLLLMKFLILLNILV